MSTIITIKNEKKVNAKTAVKKLLKEKGVKFYEHPFAQGPINYSDCKLFVPSKSTRGIAVNLDKDEIIIKVNIMCSDEDLNLAVKASKVFGKLCNSKIWVENEPEPIAYDDAENGTLKKHLVENQLAGTVFIKETLKEYDSVKIPGLFADFFPGKEFLKEEDLLKLQTKLISRFLELQNLENKGIRISTPLIAEKDGKRNDFLVLTYGHRQLVRGCDFISLADVSNEHFVIIPRADFVMNLGYSCNQIDDVQFVFPALKEREFLALMSRMEKFHHPF